MGSLRTRHKDHAQSADFCDTCDDRGYIARPGKEYSFAERCPGCWSGCEICSGRGQLFHRDAFGAMTSKACECQKLERRIRLYNAAHVPRRYAGATIKGFDELANPFGSPDGPKDRSKYEAKLTFLKLTTEFQPGDRGIGITGPVGTGKTHLMAALVRELTLELGVRARFIEFSHLLGEIRAGYDENRSAESTLDHLVDIPVLVIDELGKGLSTEWQTAILDSLISRRYNRDVSTFFTTNFPFRVGDWEPEHRSREHFEVTPLEERIGARMASRLREMCDELVLDGPDYRRLRAAARL